MNWKAFRLLGESECRDLAQALAEPTSAWAADWFSMSPAVDVRVGNIDMDSLAADAARECWTAGEGDAWAAILPSAAARKAVLARIQGGGEGVAETLSPVAARLADSCLERLIAALLPRGTDAAAAKTDSVGKMRAGELALSHGGGAVAGELMLDRCTVPFFLGPALVERYVPFIQSVLDGPPLARRSEGLGKESVRVQVTAGAAELTLDELSRLSIGDVIRLDRKVEEGFAVGLAGGQAQSIGRSLLGTRNERKAIRLRKTNPKSTH